MSFVVRVSAVSAFLWRWLRAPFWFGLGAGVAFLLPYALYLDGQVRERFDDLSWTAPTRVYARPLELKPGLRLDTQTLLLELEAREAGMTALESQGELLPAATLESLKRNRVGLKGPMTTPIGSGFRSVNVGLRQELGLYANLRPGKSLEGVQSAFHDIDLVVIRENLEGMYSGIEFDTGSTEAAEVIDAQVFAGRGAW